MTDVAALDFRTLLFEEVPMPCAVLSTDFTIAAVNGAYERVAKRSREEIIGRSLFEAFPDNPNDPDATGVSNLRASLERVLADRRTDVLDEQRYDVRCSRGGRDHYEERYWRAVNKPILDADGEVAWIIHLVEELTERIRTILDRRRAEEALAATVAGRKAVLDSVGEGLVVLDRDFRFIEVNRETVRLDGRAEDDLLGHTLWDAWPGTVGNPIEEGLRRAMRDRVSVAFEHRYVDKANDHWLEIRAYASDPGLTVLFRDINARKRAEAALRESEERFRHMADNAPVMVGVTDADGRAIYLSKSWYTFTGQAPDMALGHGWLEMLHPGDQDQAFRTFLAAHARHEAFSLEYRLRRHDGEWRWAINAAVPRFAEDGTFLGHVGSVIDITERKEAEEAQLKAREAAEQANVAKSRFLASASHDLRQPVQSLLLFLEVLKPHVAAQGQEALKHLGRGLDALRDLLDSLLDISRLEAGAVQPTVQDFPIRNLIEEVEAAYGPVAAAKGLRLHVACGDAAVRSDRTLLGRMVRNLVENALRYTEAGHIEVECREIAGHLRIEVRDTGIGIRPDQLGRIWDEFHQVGNPERDRMRGLGLGLSIVQRLSILLGHSVDVRSTPGEGSTFAIEAPLGEATQAAAPEASAKAEGNGRLAVLVDDDPLVLLGLTGIFESWGYQVLVAGSVDEMAERLRDARRRPDVIVSDYRLRGGRTGTEVVLKARAMQGAGLPGILLTGETGAEVSADAASHGLGIIHKPVTPRQLSDALSRLI